MLVPEEGGRVRTRSITGWTGLDVAPNVTVNHSGDGYSVFLQLPIDSQEQFGLNVLINDAVPGRERRRGQLVLSGAHGEFVYLRGDRHGDERLLSFIVEP